MQTFNFLPVWTHLYSKGFNYSKRRGEKALWLSRKEALVLAVDIVPTDSCREEVLCLSSQAWLFWDKRAAPLSLCKRSHRSGRRSKSSNHLCCPHTHIMVHLGLALLVHSHYIVHSYLCPCGLFDERCIVKNAGKPPHMFSFW